MRALASHLAFLAMVGCGGAPAAQGGGEPKAAEAAPAQDLTGAPVTRDPLDEASARRLLAARFRAAGLRIVEDVPVAVEGVTLVVDGLDPARRIGYEYVAAEERGVELDAAERERLGSLRGVRLLVQDAGQAGELERAASEFLAGVAAVDSGAP